MGSMRRLLVILLLCPLTAAAAGWTYEGQTAASGGASSGESSSPDRGIAEAATTGTGMARVAGPAPADAPSNSMTMAQVRATKGDPDTVFEAVGEPPITRWQYPEYVVYFERDLVITSVAGHW